MSHPLSQYHQGPKVHLIKDKEKRTFYCGRYETILTNQTEEYDDTTCRTCEELYKLSKGMVDRYAFGGRKEEERGL